MARLIHHDLAPVIGLGHGSSGTTILSKMLREYFRISFGTEAQFIVRYYNRLPRYGDLSCDANFRRLLDDLLSERWFQKCRMKWEFQPQPSAILARVQQRTYRGLLDAIFLSLAQHNHMAQRWGDKTPEFRFHLPAIGQLFPDAKFIHIVRDGRDVALSVMNRYFGAKNVFVAAQEWRDTMQRIESFLTTIPPDRKIVVHYEQLLASPAQTFEKLMPFLGIEDQGANVLTRISENAATDLVQTNHSKWKVAFSPTQMQQYESIAGQTLASHGYETKYSGPPAHPDLLERAYWAMDNRVKKYLWAQYWKDNLYKAHLRLHDWKQSAGTIIGRTQATAYQQLVDK